MSKEQPLIIKFSLAIATINMILSALVIIGLPVIVTQMLAGKMKTRNGYLLLFYDALTLIPIGQAIYMEAYLK